MDWSYSPHREGGGTLHLPSPTHPHAYHVDAIQKLRRSLSRSPSKPSRFPLQKSRTPNGSTPGSPLSPFEVARAVSPVLHREHNVTTPSWSPLAEQTPTSKQKKFTLRRVAPFRSSPRINATPRSPMRRVLSDSSNQGNITPSASRRSSGDENPAVSPERASPLKSQAKQSALRLDFNDGPIKFEFSRSKQENSTPIAEKNFPVKSSPLKRVDGRINLDQRNFGSPAKRRSLHGANVGSDADVFAQSTTAVNETSSMIVPDSEPSDSPFATPGPRRASSLRKSTLHHRYAAPGSTRTRLSAEHAAEFAPPTPPAMKARHRMSLDSSLLIGQNMPSPFVRQPAAGMSTPIFGQRQLPHRPTGQQPHPLSQAQTASSGSSLVGNSPLGSTTPLPDTSAAPKPPRFHAHFSKSLPPGFPRPDTSFESQPSSQGSTFETPEAYKFAKPLPAAFRSTGLISKRNRNVDSINDSQVYHMPDTPSKRASFPPGNATPLQNSVARRAIRPPLEFGSPSSPFVAHVATPELFGKSIGKFTPFANHALTRRSSFVSVDGEENSQSPSGQHDSQSSADELPPTPTKPGGSKGKESSLRSSLFGRRTSLGPDTFVPPGAVDIPAPKDSKNSEWFYISSNDDDIEYDAQLLPSKQYPEVVHHNVSVTYVPMAQRTPVRRNAAPRFVSSKASIHSNLSSFSAGNALGIMDNSGRTSPHTPVETFTPPDPSGLSISAGQNRLGFSFSSSTNSNPAVPPETPTAPRDYMFQFGKSTTSMGGSVSQNAVDPSLKARFRIVNLYGNGEFSQVYRVEKPVGNPFAPQGTSSPVGGVYAVKKSKQPIAGPKDRERRMKEVEILKALRGNDHIIAYVDNWESSGHLYIQTEFCEDGNLKDFLSTLGMKGRLDDFRVWKILLELSLGVKHIHNNNFIHLDLKPANIFIDYEGVLKIGDFGLASSWPAPRDIDGEGDREYIAPEVLSGRYDKPADIYTIGMIIIEIACNAGLPPNGTSWQRLRHGDFSEIPSLTFSSESTLPRNESGEPLRQPPIDFIDFDSDGEADKFVPDIQPARRVHELVVPPDFMMDSEHKQSLDKIVFSMVAEDPDMRPTIEQVYQFQGVQWVERRRRSGATIYEGNWGPADDVLNHEQDVDMTDV